MTTAQQRYIWIVAAVVLLFIMGGGNLPIIGQPAVDRITYVYDLESQVITSDVRAAIRDVGRSGISAETLDINMDVLQERDKPAHQAAVDGETPCLVVQAGDKVVETIAKPTPEQIRGFIQE